MRAHRASVLNSVIGNRYYAPLAKGGEPEFGGRGEKKEGEGGRRVVSGRRFFSPPGLLSKAFRRRAKIGERF